MPATSPADRWLFSRLPTGAPCPPADCVIGQPETRLRPALITACRHSVLGTMTEGPARRILGTTGTRGGVVTQRQLASFVLVGLALVAVAWPVRGSDGRAGPPGKSGGTAGLVLRLAVLEYPGKPAAQIAERYAQRVDDLSNGAIRVTIGYWATGLERTTPSSRVEAARDPRSPGRRAAARAHPVARVRSAGGDDAPAAAGAAADHLLGPGGPRHHGCAHREPAPGRPDRARADRVGTGS